MLIFLINKFYAFYVVDLGVAVGAGWQSLVAYINLGCYYAVGLPAGILLGFTFGLGAEVMYYLSNTQASEFEHVISHIFTLYLKGLLNNRINIFVIFYCILKIHSLFLVVSCP